MGTCTHKPGKEDAGSIQSLYTEVTENEQGILGDFPPRAEVPCGASKVNVRTALMDSRGRYLVFRGQKASDQLMFGSTSCTQSINTRHKNLVVIFSRKGPVKATTVS